MTTSRPTSRPDTAGVPGTPREIGPARFQRTEGPEPLPNLAASLGSALLLVLLVVGVPVALVWLGGVPGLPTSLPTREQLTATIGPEQLLTVLVWVVWLAWLQFAICVAVELRSALSGVGMPGRVPLAGPSQRFARTLVASVLLLVTAAGQATALTPDQMTPPTDATGAVSSHTTTAPAGWDVTADAGPGAASAPVAAASGTAHDGADTRATAVAAAETVTYRLGDQVLGAEEGEQLVGQRVYVVQPPEGRYHDNLWDIAERTLGDGRRYQEIFELNKGRDQPDGHELSLARLIYPEWLLIMPDDATGVDRVTAEVAPVPAPEPAPVPSDAGGAQAAAAGAQEATGAAGTGTEGADAAADQVAGVAPDSGPTPQALVGAGLLAAGLLAAVEQLRRRRRTTEPSDEAVEIEVALRVGATPHRVDLLDRGLRQLAGALRDHGRDLPGVYAAVVDDAALRLHLAPAEAEAPAPWRVAEDGRHWVLDATDLEPRGRRGPAPFPGLVSVGQDAQGSDVLLDLEAAQGPIAVVGDAVVAREVATALAAELATNRWSDGLRVSGLGLPSELAVLEAGRYRAVGSVDEVLPGLRDRRADVLGADVLTGRLRGSGTSTWQPEYLVLGHLPSPDLAARLVELTTTEHRSPLGVVCVGELAGARWRLQVDDAGALDVRLLDLQVQANRLGAAQLAGVAELLTAAEDDAAPADARIGAIEHEPQADRPDVTAPEKPVAPADLASAPVRVHVLGSPRVEAAGPLEAGRTALATELVVHLALHPEGVHPTVLASAVWPRGVTAAVREASIERARSWLGHDAYGTPHLREYLDGRLHLGPGAVLDWDVVRTALAHARTAPRAQERRDLAEALRLAPGAVLAERPEGRYAWLARVRLERSSRALLVDAAHRLAQLCWEDDDPDAAREAAEAGLRVSPTEELLWRDLLRAAAATGGVEATRRVAADLERALHSAGVPEMSAATAALLTELVPAMGPLRGATGPA